MRPRPATLAALAIGHKLPLSTMINIVRLKRAMRPLKRARKFVAALILEEDQPGHPFFNAALSLFIKGYGEEAFGRGEIEINVVTKELAKQKSDDIDFGKEATLIIGYRSTLSGHLLMMSDYVADVPPTTTRDIRIAVSNTYGEEITEADAELILCSKGFIDIDVLIQRGRPISRSMSMLREIMCPKPVKKLKRGPQPVARFTEDGDLEMLAAPAETRGDEGPRLEQLAGYGEAMDWGLDLAKDLQAYRDGNLAWALVSKGLLLSGPPGCGKTTYAKALARTCGVPLIIGSYAQWAAGHGQTDLLKKMRQSFDAAAKAAPCILFIDEVDSFHDRDSMPDYMAAWERQVVNGLLELVDGVGSNDGVVVIGACNNPGVIDSALKRAGRLDHHIQIPLPDTEAREGIIRHHARQAGYHFAPSELDEVADRTHGESGASLEKLVRDAIRRARRLDRSMTIADLLDSLPERVPLADDYMQRAAVHEVGHALVGIITGKEKLLGIAIADSFSPSDRQTGGIGGGVQFESSFGKIRTKSFYLGQIATMLAAGAAEEMIYGDSADGRVHDLMMATDYATRIEVCLGYGPTLMAEGDLDHKALQALRFRDRDLQERIDRTLRDQMQLAKDILLEHRDLVVSLADQLVVEKSLEPEFIYRALKQQRMRVAS